MLSHHKTGPLCIPLLYTLQHLSVCGHDSLHNTTFRCNKFADFDHEVIDRVKQQCEQRIVRSLGETSMEIGVLDGKEYRIFLDRFHFPNDATKILNVIFRGLLGCQADVLHFKKRTDLVQMIEADISTPRAQEQVQRLHHFFPAQCANGSADAMGGFQKAARSEAPTCSPNYPPTTPQPLRDLLSGGSLVPTAKRSERIWSCMAWTTRSTSALLLPIVPKRTFRTRSEEHTSELQS